MTAVYVKEQGAIVARRGERLVVKKEGDVLEEFPLSQVEQVVVMGNVQMTTQIMATLAEREIDVVFLSSYGKYRFRTEGEGSKHVALRQRQLRVMSDGRLALPVAQTIVDAKINNQRVILQRQASRITSSGQQNRGATVWPRDRSLFDRALD
ncbi:MAG: CRISPR-associated endonuclease Cas1, partial [Chloroflexi bacterium]|nr:CRISPR-associated endonuclease Cas1 [Chloroflexota bacterium]